MAFFSTTITPTTSIQLLLAAKPNIKKCLQLIASIRSMGTSTYSALGGFDSQEKRMTFVRDFIGIEVTQGKKWFDPSSIFIISDTADAVIEIFGQTYDQQEGT